MTIRSYRDLDVWQKAMVLTVECYQLSRRFPRSEQYGLTSQLQRAAASVPANIAEGHGRGSTGDYLRHLSIAQGSVTELETHLLIAQRLAYLTTSDAARALHTSQDVGRMLTGLVRSLRKRTAAPHKLQAPNP